MSGVTPMATEEAMIETPKFKNLKHVDPGLKPKQNNFLDSSEFVSSPTLSNLQLNLKLNLDFKGAKRHTERHKCARNEQALHEQRHPKVVPTHFTKLTL